MVFLMFPHIFLHEHKKIRVCKQTLIHVGKYKKKKKEKKTFLQDTFLYGSFPCKTVWK